MNVRDLVPSIWRRGSLPMRRGEEEHPFYTLQREMNELFDDFFHGFDITPFGDRERSLVFSPSIDVKEDDKEILVKAELPGIDEKDVEVTLTDDALTIKGEKKEEKEEKGKGYYHMERSYGSFNRVIPLPERIDTKKAEAHFKNGILSVKLPKTTEAKAKANKIPIQTG